MAHPENEPPAKVLVETSIKAWKECFRIAEHILSSGHEEGWKNDEARDRYMAFVPMIAQSLHQEMNAIGGFAREAGEPTLLRAIESGEHVVKILEGCCRE